MVRLRQSKFYASTVDSTNHQVVLDNPPAVDSLIIVFVVHTGDMSAKPPNYTIGVQTFDSVWGRCYYKVAEPGEPTAIPIVLSSSNPACMMAFEYSGMNVASPADQIISSGGVGSGTTIVSPTTATTAQAEELIFVSANMRTAEVPAQTVTAWTNSFVSLAEVTSTNAVSTNVLLNVAVRQVTSINTYQSTGSITTGGTGNDVAVIAAFKIYPSPPISWLRA